MKSVPVARCDVVSFSTQGHC